MNGMYCTYTVLAKRIKTLYVFIATQIAQMPSQYYSNGFGNLGSLGSIEEI